MAKIRSPNYPGISLPDAIERIKKIHAKAHTHKVDAETMAKAAGYGGLNGAALTVLSALKKYDLLEEIGKEIRVSPLAMTIIADRVDSLDRRTAIQTAAFAPNLFIEIRKQFPDSVPGDEIVRSFLIKRSFSASSVDTAIRAFRETMNLVTDEGMGYNAFEELGEHLREMGSVESANEVARGGAMQTLSDTGRVPQIHREPQKAIQAAFKQDVYTLGDEGQVVLQWPEKLVQESFDEIEEWIKLQLKKIARLNNLKPSEKKT